MHERGESYLVGANIEGQNGLPEFGSAWLCGQDGEVDQ
jgi:hypothetical protein